MTEQDLEQAAWGHETEKAMPVEKIEDFENIIRRAYELETEIKAAEELHVNPLKREAHDIELKILATLQHFNKKSYKTPFGMVIRAEKFSVSFPKDPAEKQKLIKYMGQENFIDMASINYNTFNSFYKDRLEAAVEEGNLDFEVPGVGKPKYVEHLQKRKA